MIPLDDDAAIEVAPCGVQLIVRHTNNLVALMSATLYLEDNNLGTYNVESVISWVETRKRYK